MPDDDKAKAEKLAAAKKRVEELKKKTQGKKKSAGVAPGKKEDTASQGKSTDTKPSPPAASIPKDEKSDDKSATEVVDDKEGKEDSVPVETPSTPSLAEQSRLRSASFRTGSGAGGINSPITESPIGETAPDIYRKHVARIEELEKENKRLVLEAAASQKKWEKAEKELAAREHSSDDDEEKNNETIKHLKTEIAALTRQNAQLQSQTNRQRHNSSASIAAGDRSSAEMEALLKSKSSQIEAMEVEMSRLRAQLLKPPPTDANEQVTALQDKLTRAETAATKAQGELIELRKSLDRSTENAIREGSGRSSAETAAANAQREAESAKIDRDEAVKRADALEKKVTAMVGIHKEQDQRMQALRREKAALDREVDELRGRVATLEKRLSARPTRQNVNDGKAEDGNEKNDSELDDEGINEVEADEVDRLTTRIRDLEAENYDLRRGIWHERRKTLQTGPEDLFQDVDLGGSGPTTQQQPARKPAVGLGELFNVITGADQFQAHRQGTGAAKNAQRRRSSAARKGVLGRLSLDDDDGLLEDENDDDNDEDDFDEEAFRAAQEQEMQRRMERVREAKRALSNWVGYRLDLVDARTASGEGAGEIFEV